VIEQVIPIYYQVDEDGVPRPWVKLMKRAIKSTAAAFSARRIVKEYSLKFYQGALKASGE
jgi:starch phosphorylase